MNKYLVSIVAVVSLLISICLNLYLVGETTKEIQYKKQILELREKQIFTSSMALQTVYQDSINNTVEKWLEDGTSK